MAVQASKVLAITAAAGVCTAAYFLWRQRRARAAFASNGEHVMTVCGGGLIGCLLAVVLKHKGHRVVLFERGGDVRTMSAAGRSINLSMTVRGLRALSCLPPQVKAELLQLSTHVTGRIIHVGGDEIFQRYGKDDTEYNHAVSRHELNRFLLDQAQKAGVEIHFNHALQSADWSGEGTTLCFKAGDVDKAVLCAGPVFGTDGAASRLRQTMQDAGICDVDIQMLESGYKEMSFPKDAAEAHGMARHGLHIWPRGDHMLMALPNLDGSFTGTIYIDNETKAECFKALEDGGVPVAKAFLEQHYKDALPLLGGLESAAEKLVKNHRGALGTVRVKQWHVGGKVVLLGDSSHAIVPFFGQGMNCGFEDVKVLAELLDQYAPACPKDYEACFAAFQAARRPNANAIADMALENFHEMQSKTADPQFRLYKAVENALENSCLGDRFRSRYSMVCYGGAGNVSYSAAQKLGRVQWEIAQELAKGVSTPENAATELDLALAEKLLAERLFPMQQELGIDLSAVSHHE